MFGNMNASQDPKKKVLEELMQYLDGKDGEELGEAAKPKGLGVEVTKVEGLGDPKDHDPSKSPGVSVGDDSPMDDSMKLAGGKPSDDELDELIQALQAKLGA